MFRILSYYFQPIMSKGNTL